MCGRFGIWADPETIAGHFDAAADFIFDRRYNVAPTQEVPVVRLEKQGRRLAMMRWGLIPRWSKDRSIGSKLINARAESVWQKPAFRDAAKKRRCLVPVSGFYEWQKQGGGKQPYLVRLQNRELLALAGLWETWHDPEKDIDVETFVIITTAANSALWQLHDRMPAIVASENYDRWLDPHSLDPQTLDDLLAPSDDHQLAIVPVSKRINSPKEDDAELIDWPGPD